MSESESLQLDPTTLEGPLDKLALSFNDQGEVSPKEQRLSENQIGWIGFHPDLPPIDEQSSKPFIVVAKRSPDTGVFERGLMRSMDEAVTLEFIRQHSGDCEIHVIWGREHLTCSHVDITTTVQRGGHGPCQMAVAEELGKRMGVSTRIFSPTHSTLAPTGETTTAPFRYLDEVGYTPNITPDRDGRIHPSLPTDKTAERSMLSLMALASTNWHLFCQLANTNVAISDSKAEAGHLAVAIKSQINPDLKIIQMATALFDIHPRTDTLFDPAVTAQFVQNVGLKHLGIPNFLDFMLQKVNAISELSASEGLVVHMGIAPCAEVEERARKEGHENVIATPLIARDMPSNLDRSTSRAKFKIGEGEKVILVKIASNPQLERMNLQEFILQLAANFPDSRIMIVGDPSQAFPAVNSNELPQNIDVRGWIPDRETVFQLMATANCIVTPGGTTNSPVEALHVCKLTGAIPMLIAPTSTDELEELTEEWSKLPLFVNGELNLNKLLGVQITVETLPERNSNMHNLLDAMPELEKLVVHIAKRKDALETIRSALQKEKELAASLEPKIETLNIGGPEVLVEIIEQLLMASEESMEEI